jgi:SAM-dependent methyltransferase
MACPQEYFFIDKSMAWDTVWEEIFRSQSWGKYPPEDLIRFISRNYSPTKNRANIKILEVGCGPGANCWYLAREGFSFVGVDGSSSAINQAKDRLNLECPGWESRGELLVSDMASIPFENDTFDVVIDIEAIYCNDWYSSMAIYAELARVAKPGAKLFSRTFAKGSWGDGTGLCVGKDTWKCTDGPLGGKGASRFTDLNDIATLIQGFVLQEVELMTRTMGNREREIMEWVIVGEKC